MLLYGCPGADGGKIQWLDNPVAGRRDAPDVLRKMLQAQHQGMIEYLPGNKHYILIIDPAS